MNKGDDGHKVTVEAETVAQAYLELLSLRGIDYFFANPGTDFASIIDGFVCREEYRKEGPKPLAIPHEIPLVAMAHGYYLATGRVQAAMVHVGVGTANGIGGIMAAHHGRIPILFCAGRTPITEEGDIGSRSAFIHWGQECFDQAGMLREFVKWDYELRTPGQIEGVIDRALTMALSEPKGPVYLSMPREVMASPMGSVTFDARHRYDLPTYHPDPEKTARAAELLVEAESPLMITSSAGRSAEAVEAMVRLAASAGIGVISFNPENMCFPNDHPCHQGFDPETFLDEADVILVVDCDVPWYPKTMKPRESAVVVQVGIDPFYGSYPIRNFPSDITLQGDPPIVLSEMTRLITQHPERDASGIETRMKRLQAQNKDMTAKWQRMAEEGANDVPINPRWLSYNVSRIMDEDTVIMNQNDYSLKRYAARHAGGFFCSPHAGYLGWAVGAGLGIKLGRPEATVIATVGDGSYMFAVPSACHYVSSAYDLPMLTIVYNNQGWDKVKHDVGVVHPEGWAVRCEHFPLTRFQAPVHYEKFCEACGGYGERVESPDQVKPALERALHAVRHEKRQALLNVICGS
ncbi:MAG: thiamine pyrophosphate-requiring protein [Deltaproteobacteria bacterium]|nr:thiamine pyrophosphate-requiring protein [Deltaproteobacteria bacterium]